MNRSLYFYLFFSILILVSRFLWVNDFGLYEDDWNFTGRVITQSFEQNISTISWGWSTFFQGRPLFITFVTLVSMLAAKVGGIKTLYGIGYLILCVNACLIYKIFNKVISQPSIPFFATVIYCLYPSDTTFIFVLHLFELQISLLFILLAFYFYFNSKEVMSYVFSILCLLTYETLFLPFLAAPLFREYHQKTKTKIIKHFVIVISITVGYVFLRKLFSSSDTRLGVINIFFLIKTIPYQLIWGPLITLSMFFIRIQQVLIPFNYRNLLILVSSIPLFYFIVTFLAPKIFPEDHSSLKQSQFQEIKKILLIGLIMTILAYPAVILLNIHDVDGRASRVHLAAVLGTGLIVACLWTWFVNLIPRHQLWKNFAVFTISIHIAFLFTFCLQVQYFYSLSWKYQQHFWRDVLTLTPDLEKNNVILLQAPRLERSGKQINPFDWSVPLVIESIYQFPQDWTYKPRLYILNSTLDNPEAWKNELIQEDKTFVLSSKNPAISFYFPWEAPRKVEPKDIILLVEDNKQFVRKDSIFLDDGQSISLKSNNKQLKFPSYPKSIIYNDLIGDSNFNNLDYPSKIYFEPQQ